MDLMKVIRGRQSIRKYKNQAVTDETLLECLDAARLAPSWANTQVSRFVVVRDQALKEGLYGALGVNNPARQAFLDAPCVVCLVAQRGLSGMKKGEPMTDKGDWFMYDAGIAMEHFVLAAWERGLGTVHVGAFDSKKAEETLGVTAGYSIVAMTPVGYFAETPSPVPRKALKDLVYLDRFDKPLIP